MKIYITRHGETEWNKEGRMQGWKDSNLTHNGIKNAEKLGKSLNNINFDSIYCSPSGRALDTAKYIRGNKNAEIIIIDSLKEINLGLWEGMEHPKIQQEYSVQHFNFWNKPHLYESYGGENFQDIVDRIRKTLDDIIDNSLKDNILIVTHAVVIKAIYSIIRNTSIEDFWNPPFIYDTCLSILEVEDKQYKFILEADVSHLG